MTDPLYTSNEDPVDLDGTIDVAGALQLVHGTDSLADYDQKLYAEHEDLSEPTGIIRIKLIDFATGGDNWVLTATHDSVTWSRGTGHAYCDFGPMTSELEVNITATSDATPPQVRYRTARIKTTPILATPDRQRY